MRTERRKTRVAALAGGCATLLCIFLLGYEWMSANSSEQSLADAKQKHARIFPKVEKIDTLTALVSKLEPKMRNLDDAQMATKRWYRILNHLAKNTPPDAWLTQIRSAQTLPTEPVALTIQGMSGGQGSAADMMNRLQASTDYEGVNLNYTSEEVANNMKGIKFELTARVTGTAAPKPGSEEGKQA